MHATATRIPPRYMLIAAIAVIAAWSDLLLGQLVSADPAVQLGLWQYSKIMAAALSACAVVFLVFRRFRLFKVSAGLSFALLAAATLATWIARAAAMSQWVR